MAHYECLTFLTDYGLEDGFVASCHGVAARIAPRLRVIDITHLVPPGDVRRGAAVLAQTVPFMPPSVHVAVVDPGVGTARRAIAVAAGEAIFVGPDNGLLSWAIQAAGETVRAFSLTNSELWLHPVSATFHGRDIFMPVAARLAAGTGLESVGEAIPPGELITLPVPASRVRDGNAEGEVVSVDRFGNVQLSITSSDLAMLGAEPPGALVVRCGQHRLTVPYRETFAAVAPGELVAFTDSAGLVSLAVNAGDAAQRLGLPPGAHVRLAVARLPAGRVPGSRRPASRRPGSRRPASRRPASQRPGSRRGRGKDGSVNVAESRPSPHTRRCLVQSRAMEGRSVA